MGDDEISFELRQLRPEDSFKSLKCGAPEFQPLKSFANQKAKKYDTQNLARTYVVFDYATDKIVAYVTLVCSEVKSAEPLLAEQDVDFAYEHYPAVKIARLLVDERFRGGLGRELVNFSIGIARNEICPAIGCRFVTVDAKQSSVGFYEKCGFTIIDTEANRRSPTPVLFMDLHKAGT